MSAATTAVVVGLDVGGAKTDAMVLTEDGRFLVDHMAEMPSGALDGPAALAAIDEAMDLVLDVAAAPREQLVPDVAKAFNALVDEF